MEGTGGRESRGELGLGWWEKVVRAVRKRSVESRVGVSAVMDIEHGGQQEQNIVEWE